MNVLVVGGAGYIGSHMVRQLDAAGHEVAVLDNLSTGFAEAVTAGQLIVGEMSDRKLVAKILCAPVSYTHLTLPTIYSV